MVKLHVLPNAPKTQIVGLYNGCLKIKIKAPPVDGKANQEIIRYFCEILSLKKQSCEIMVGDKSKTKLLLLTGVTKETVNSRLLESNS